MKSLVWVAVAVALVAGAVVAYAGEPIACQVRALSAAEHKEQAAAAARLLPKAQEVKEKAQGYAVRFSVDALDELPTWLAREQKCCPFLKLTLRFAPASNELWIEAEGTPEGKAFVKGTLIAAIEEQHPKHSP